MVLRLVFIVRTSENSVFVTKHKEGPGDTMNWKTMRNNERNSRVRK